MKIGLVVDATCDLPAPYIKEHHIQVLPISLRIGDEHVVDDRNPDTTLFGQLPNAHIQDSFFARLISPTKTRTM